MRCSEALVIDRLKIEDFHTSDSRMSVLVDEKVYNEASKSMEGNAKLYGVPIGGSYSEYKALASEIRSRYENEYHSEDALSISWSGLGKNAADAYKACLASHHVMQGLTLELDQASDKEIVLSLHWKKGIGGPEKIDLRWKGDVAAVAALPSEIADTPDGLPFIIPRPEEGSYFLAVEGRYKGIHIVGDVVKIAAITKPIIAEHIPKTLVTWAADIGNSILDEEIPLKAKGRMAKFILTGRATSRAGGSIQAIIWIDGEQVYATNRIPAENNPEMIGKATHDIEIPLLSKRIRVEFRNWDATAEFGKVELVC